MYTNGFGGSFQFQFSEQLLFALNVYTHMELVT